MIWLGCTYNQKWHYKREADEYLITKEEGDVGTAAGCCVANL